jgi:hypothetical protein
MADIYPGVYRVGFPSLPPIHHMQDVPPFVPDFPAVITLPLGLQFLHCLCKYWTLICIQRQWIFPLILYPSLQECDIHSPHSTSKRATFVSKIDSAPASTGRMLPVTERRKTKRGKGLFLCLMKSGIVDQMRYEPVGFFIVKLSFHYYLYDVHFS